jgi:hypothetical protein
MHMRLDLQGAQNSEGLNDGAVNRWLVVCKAGVVGAGNG